MLRPTRSARPMSCRRPGGRESGGSSTSRPRSAMASSRSSSRSRSTIRSGPEESSYAISKTAGEHYVRLSGLDWISFRLANAYGPRNLSGPLPTFYPAADDRQAVLRHGHAPRLHLHRGPGRPRAEGDRRDGRAGAYHISSGSDFAIKELFDATVKALGLKLEQGRRSPAARRGRRVHDPARSVARPTTISAGRRRRRSRKASRPRSSSTASTASADVHAPEAGRRRRRRSQ